jgi:Mg2+ and Co2+ transporter CorA
MKDDTLSTAFHEILEESKLHLAKAEALYKCLQSASALLSDLLPYQNASSLKSIAEDTHHDNTIMRQLTEQTTKDSNSIKTITIITVVFLPATVVAV